jgi:type II secretory pathway predicted ATPase ExeA
MSSIPQLTAASLATLGLAKQPFVPPESCDDYYVNTSLGMLINGVSQQLNTHDGIQVIKGEFGSGKTCFCKRLLCDSPDEFALLLHYGRRNQTISTIFRSLLDEPAPDNASVQDLAIQVANRIFRLLRANIQPAVLIDDAHLLPLKTLQSLLKFTNAIARQGNGRLKLIMVTERSIDETLAQLDPALLNAEDIRSTLIRPLNRQDIGDYIVFRLTRAGSGQKMPLSKKQLAAIHSKCGGLPYKIDQLSCEILNGGGPGLPGKITGKSMLAVGTLAALSAASLYWIYYKSPQTAPAQTPSLTIQMPALPPDAETGITPEEPLASGPAPDDSQNEPPTQTTETSDEIPATDAEQLPNTPTIDQLNDDAGPALPSANIFASSDEWLNAQPGDAFVIQLAGSWRRETLSKFSIELQLDPPPILHSSLRNDQAWYVLLYGPFPDYQTAQSAFQALPDALQANNPWVRSIASLKKTP